MPARRRCRHGSCIIGISQVVNKKNEWIDISVPIRSAMVHWPGDPPVEIRRVQDLERGDSHNLSEIRMGSHTGTHVDAPIHFLRGGIGIDEMPFDAAIGRARVIEIKDKESIKPEELRKHRIRRGERILFKTRNSSEHWENSAFAEDFVYVTKEAAEYLAGKRVKLVGVDYLSVGGYKKGGGEIHRLLLGAGIWIIEGLNLSSAFPGRYELICLPLRIAEGDGSPVRAVIRAL